MRRRRVFVAALVLAGLAGGVIALVLVLSGPSGRERIVSGRSRIVHDALQVSGRLKPLKAKIFHVHPTRRFPHISIAERRKHQREPLNESPRKPTRSAAPGASFVKSSSVASTAAKGLPASPTASDGALFAGARLISGLDLSFTAEPSVAANDGRILETWNWGAALSGDDGKTFSFVDPSTAFPESHDGFCCDQLAYYVPKWDLWIWLIQYSPDEDGNILRLAVARSSAAFDEARLNSTTFKLFDLSPTSFGWPKSAWFDFNGISSTDQNLFVATNVSDTAYEGVVIRIPLSELASGTLNLPDVQYWKTAPLSTPRLVQGAGDTMYFASHLKTSKLRVWTWADGSDSISRVDVAHSAYKPLRIYHCPRIGGPATSDWCEGFRRDSYKNDDDVLAGWVAKNRIGFAWNAPQDPSHGFRYPFVMAVEIDAQSMKRTAQPIIWSPKYAYQYAAIAPNARGDLGGIALRGGGKAYESCTALIRDSDSSGSPSGWDAYTLDASNADPAEPRFGDYLGIAPAGTGSNTWVAGCMDLRGGGSSRLNLAVNYLAFGRGRDAKP